MFYYFDPLYFIMIGPAIILALYAQSRVKSTFKKYSQVMSEKGLSGYEAARSLLNNNGLHDVAVELTKGRLSDHYDPRKRVLRLSPEVYNGRSLASIGVAAHEAGHAIQHKEGYVPLRLRHGLVPIASFGSQLAFPMIFLGILFNALALAKIGIIFFAGAVIFQIVTLPVEFNASSRALALIENSGIVTEREADGAKAVLSSAALTYVASAAVAVMQLLYFILRAQGRD